MPLSCLSRQTTASIESHVANFGRDESMVFAEANSCFESYHLSGISRDMGLHEAPMLSKTPMNENDIFCTNALFITGVIGIYS